MSAAMTNRDAFSLALRDHEGEALYDEPLSRHCSFKIGGPAEILFIPHTEEALLAAMRFAAERGLPCRVLGNGSNVLISDEGLKGVTIKLMGGLTALSQPDEMRIACGAGVSLKRLCVFALDASLTGLEFAYGIPGSVGGAVYMNAGAYKGEIKDVLETVRCLDPKTLEITERPAAGLGLAYRSTPFMKNGEIILSAVFRLAPGEQNAIRARMNELMAKRKASQPLEYPSAGSTFKRPAVGYAAAMIDQTGLKGYRVGGAEVSEKHAGFVINKENATFSDVMGVISHVRSAVAEKFGVALETEVEILGE